MNKPNTNLDLYNQIRAARENKGLPVENLDVKLDNYEMIGKTLYSAEKEKNVKVVKAHKQWHCGWYIVLIAIDDKNSHSTIFWRSIDCKDENILRRIDLAHERFFETSDS